MDQFLAAQSLLRARRYEEAWPLYERRFSRVDHLKVQSSASRWDGQNPRGKRIAVCAEQGFGDQIMFGRWLPRLIEAGADVLVVCHPSLERLFGLLGVETAIARTDRPLPRCDYWLHFGSLPLALRDPLPPRAHYLPFKSIGCAIGVVASGSPTNSNDANRSLPSDAAETLRTIGRDVSQAATGAYEFLTTAHILAGLARLVTVDTSMAHLAGAIGLPFTVLLPHVGLDWRWNDARRSDWYPDAHLLRQCPDGDWSEALRRATP